jgi:nucleotide-binding universal stress UspA family protein
MKVLLAVDGSPVSRRATQHAVRLARQLASPPELALFYADAPLLQSVAIKLGAEAVRRYHEENGHAATRGARALLKRAHLDFAELVATTSSSWARMAAGHSRACCWDRSRAR